MTHWFESCVSNGLYYVSSWAPQYMSALVSAAWAASARSLSAVCKYGIYS